MKRPKLKSWYDVIRFFYNGFDVSENGCWVWKRGKTKLGYGIISFDGGKRHIYAHRLSLIIRNDRIELNGIDVCHKCDNPPCVNPDHLFPATHAENIADARAKGRMKCPPHKYGSLNGHSKLNEAKIRAIRHARDRGVGRYELARQFGVTPGAIWFIEKRKTWRHV